MRPPLARLSSRRRAARARASLGRARPGPAGAAGRRRRGPVQVGPQRGAAPVRGHGPRASAPSGSPSAGRPASTKISAVDLGGLAARGRRASRARARASSSRSTARPTTRRRTPTAAAQYCGYVRSILVGVPGDPRRRDLERGQQLDVLEAAVQPDGTAVGSRRVRGAARGVLRDAPHGAPGLNVITSLAPRGNDDPRFATAVSELAGEVRARARRRLPGERPPGEDLRHVRPERLRAQLRRAAVAVAHARAASSRRATTPA